MTLKILASWTPVDFLSLQKWPIIPESPVRASTPTCWNTMQKSLGSSEFPLLGHYAYR